MTEIEERRSRGRQTSRDGDREAKRGQDKKASPACSDLSLERRQNSEEMDVSVALDVSFLLVFSPTQSKVGIKLFTDISPLRPFVCLPLQGLRETPYLF